MQDPEREAAERLEEAAVARTFRLAAQYIALSFALQSGELTACKRQGDMYVADIRISRGLPPSFACGTSKYSTIM